MVGTSERPGKRTGVCPNPDDDEPLPGRDWLCVGMPEGCCSGCKGSLAVCAAAVCVAPQKANISESQRRHACFAKANSFCRKKMLQANELASLPESMMVSDKRYRLERFKLPHTTPPDPKEFASPLLKNNRHDCGNGREMSPG